MQRHKLEERILFSIVFMLLIIYVFIGIEAKKKISSIEREVEQVTIDSRIPKKKNHISRDIRIYDVFSGIGNISMNKKLSDNGDVYCFEYKKEKFDLRDLEKILKDNINFVKVRGIYIQKEGNYYKYRVDTGF